MSDSTSTPLQAGSNNTSAAPLVVNTPAPEATPTVAPKPSFVYNTIAATQKLQEVEAFYVKYHGHAGFNPHFFLKKEYLPLKDAHNSPDVPKTEELFKKIMALECLEANAKANGSKYYGNRTAVTSAIAGLSKAGERSHEVKQHPTNSLPPATFNPAASLKKP